MKAEKFSKAARAAAQQSRQVKPPRVTVVTSLVKALEMLPSPAGALLASCSLEHDAPPLAELASHLQPGGTVCLAIGPEGDLSPDELQNLSLHGFKAASLGRQVLRSELAVITAVITVKNAI